MKQLFYINNDQSDPQQVLLIRIGEKHACFAITNKKGSELYELAWCSSEDWSHTELDAFYSSYPSLKLPFLSIQLVYDHPVSALVPAGEGLYDAEFIPSDLVSWVTTLFPEARSRNQFSVTPVPSADRNGLIMADIRGSDFALTVIREGKILLNQNFEYASPADILYYLLKACNRFSLSQNEVDLQLSGLVDQESALYRDLFQYFIHTGFRKPFWAGGGEEYPSHYFTSLNDLSACVS